MATAEDIYGKKKYVAICPECKREPITEGAKFAFNCCTKCFTRKIKAEE